MTYYFHERRSKRSTDTTGAMNVKHDDSSVRTVLFIITQVIDHQIHIRRRLDRPVA